MRIHLLSRGEVVMSDFAIALQSLGNQVSISPQKSNLNNSENPPENLSPDIETVIASSSIPNDCPELVEAKKLGLKIQSLPAFVAEMYASKQRVVICGSNGKTTALAMALHCLERQNVDFDFVSGEEINGFDSCVRLSGSEVLILEASEMPAFGLDSIPEMVAFQPTLAVCNNISFVNTSENVDFQAYSERFGQLMDALPEGSNFIWFREDETIKKLVEARKSEAKFFSVPFEAFPSEIIRGVQTIKMWGKPRAPMACFGHHNLANAKAAFMVCRELGVSIEDFLQDLATFNGLKARLETLESTRTCNIWHDLANAPARVLATIEAARLLYPERTLSACFELQPRGKFDKAFLSKFNGSLDGAKDAFVFCPPELLENSKFKIEEIVEAFAHPNLSVFSNPEYLVGALKDLTLEDHNILFMSSGDFGGLDLWKTAKSLFSFG